MHSTAREAAVSPHDRAAWEDADDGHLVSPVFILQRLCAGFEFVGNRHDDGFSLHPRSNSPVPNHGATFVPSVPQCLDTRFYWCTN